MGRLVAALLMILVSTELFASGFVRFGEFQDHEFSPVRGEVFEIPLLLERESHVRIELVSVDGGKVRVLESDGALDEGEHVLVWDGKDDSGVVVPDEAYTPILIARSSIGEDRVDPRDGSGGEIIDDIKLARNDHRSLSYQLPAPARVSIRAGVSAGPLLKVLSDWEPRAAGRNIVYWDGFDNDRLIDLKSTGRQKLVVAAYRLPDYSIITSGNKHFSYVEYFKKRGWKIEPVNLADVPLQRNGQPVSRHHYIPHLMNKSPNIRVEFLGELKKSPAGNPVISDKVSIRVDMDDDSKWALQESRYEIGFFVNNQFLSEEEQGYVPLTWRWKPDGLEPGVHVLTVNLSGFLGQVGVKSVRFEIPPLEGGANENSGAK